MSLATVFRNGVRVTTLTVELVSWTLGISNGTVFFWHKRKGIVVVWRV